VRDPPAERAIVDLHDPLIFWRIQRFAASGENMSAHINLATCVSPHGRESSIED
jgi:hypothetical protein